MAEHLQSEDLKTIFALQGHENVQIEVKKVHSMELPCVRIRPGTPNLYMEFHTAEEGQEKAVISIHNELQDFIDSMGIGVHSMSASKNMDIGSAAI